MNYAVILASFLLMFLVGIGPSLYFITKTVSNRLMLACCLAPTIGFAVITIVLSPFVLTDHPIANVAVLVLVLVLVLSFGLLLTDLRKNYKAYRKAVDLKQTLVILLCAVLVFGALILPATTGGMEFSMWQGNPWDAMNYILYGWFAQHVPWSFIANPAHYNDVFNANPSLISIMSGVEAGGRSAMFFSLGWLSSIFNVPVYSLYYPIKLLSLLLAFFASLAVGKLLRLILWQNLLLASVTALGFWAFFVVDIDAGGQITALPRLLMALCAWLLFEKNKPEKLISPQTVFFGFSIAAVLNAYPEVLAPFGLALGIYYGWALIRKGEWKQTSVKLLAVLAIAGIFALPQLISEIGFFNHQMNFTISVDRKDQQDYFYAWLFNANFLTQGIWGLHFFDGFIIQPISLILLSLIGGGMTISLVWGIVQAVRNHTSTLETKILAACVVAFWGGGLLLLLLDRKWFSGKIFGMGYPLVMIALCLFTVRRINVQRSTGLVPSLLYILFAIWLALQVTIPAIRLRAIKDNKAQFGDYVPIKAQLVNRIMPVMQHLQTQQPKLLASDFRQVGIFLPPLWSAMLSERFNLLPLHGFPIAYNQPPFMWKESDALPDQILVTQSANYLVGIGRELESNDTLALYSVTPDDIDTALFNANILRRDENFAITTFNIEPASEQDATVVRWMIGDEAKLRFLASGKIPVELALNFRPDYTGSLSVYVNNNLIETREVSKDKAEQLTLSFEPKIGTNTIRFVFEGNNLPEHKLLIDGFEIKKGNQ